MTPYFQDSAVTLYLADALTCALPPAAVTITDPPYGSTKLPWDRWLSGWPSKMTASSNSMWVFGTLRQFVEHASDFSDWEIAADVVWEKQNGSSFIADRFRRIHESVVHFYRGGWANVYRDPQYDHAGVRRSVRTKRRPPHMGQIERTPYRSEDGGPVLTPSILYAPSMHGTAIHPTQKPLNILKPIIQYSCAPGEIVLDPFAGSGSTLIAARACGRRAVGFEVNEQYAEAAARWLSEPQQLEAVVV